MVTVVLFFGLLEGILRLVYRPDQPFRFYSPHPQSVVQYDSELGYRLRPNFKGQAYASSVQVNSLGFRGPEFDPDRKTGLRVVALGDSCTFGFGVSDNDHTYPARLAAFLNQTHGPAEVINAGVVGYTSNQALRLLQTRVSHYHADILLIFVGWNDLGNSMLPNWTPTMTQDIEAPNALIRYAPYLVLALSDLFSRFRAPRALGFRAEAIEAYSVNLGMIVDAARKSGTAPVLVTWPTRVFRQIEQLRQVEVMRGSGVRFASWFDYYERYQRKLRDLAGTKQVRVIDLAEKMNQKDATYYFDEIHFSDVGTMEAAQVIFDGLGDLLSQSEKGH